jgi:hypothetical protein
MYSKRILIKKNPQITLKKHRILTKEPRGIYRIGALGSKIIMVVCDID